MEFLKWIGSFVLAVIGVSVLIGGGLILSAFGALLWVVVIFILLVCLIAGGIKESLDNRGDHRDK